MALRRFVDNPVADLPLTGAETFPAVQNGGDVRVLLSDVLDLIGTTGAAPVVTLSGTAYTLADLISGAWHEFTSADPVTITVLDDAVERVSQNTEFGLMAAGAGGVTVVPDAAAVIEAPRGGTLALPQGGFAMLKRRDADLYKLLGETEDVP